MRPVPISLAHAFTTEINVQANPAIKIDQPPTLDLSELRCDHTTLQPTEKQTHWRVQLKLAQDATPQNNAPYSFRIVMEGWFTLTPDFPADQSERFISINGTAILYGLAREQLRSAMSAGPFVPIMLPSVTFAPAATIPPTEKV
jgi:preprotein translocase subunit SecB